jgi:putative transposase
MSRWHNVYLDGHVHFCISTVAGWEPRLTAPAKALLYREWEAVRRDYCVRVLAFVVMPEHFHLLLWAERGVDVRRFLQRVLANTSRQLQRGGRFWKERPRVLAVWSPRVMRDKLDYIHLNPLKRELVAKPEDWRDSSFREIELGLADGPFVCDSWDGIWV